MLVTNSIKLDLNHLNPYIVGLAVTALVCKGVSKKPCLQWTRRMHRVPCCMRSQAGRCSLLKLWSPKCDRGARLQLLFGLRAALSSQAASCRPQHEFVLACFMPPSLLQSFGALPEPLALLLTPPPTRQLFLCKYSIVQLPFFWLGFTTANTRTHTHAHAHPKQGNICSAEMARDLTPDILRLLSRGSPYERKKAHLCITRSARAVLVCVYMCGALVYICAFLSCVYVRTYACKCSPVC